MSQCASILWHSTLHNRGETYERFWHQLKKSPMHSLIMLKVLELVGLDTRPLPAQAPRRNRHALAVPIVLPITPVPCDALCRTRPVHPATLAPCTCCISCRIGSWYAMAEPLTLRCASPPGYALCGPPPRPSATLFPCIRHVGRVGNRRRRRGRLRLRLRLRLAGSSDRQVCRG